MIVPLKVELDVSDLQKSLDFYIGKLEFEVEYTREKNKFVAITRDGIHLMLQEIGSEMMNWKTGELEYPFGRGINLTLKLSDIDKVYKNFKTEELFKDMAEHWFDKDDETKAGLREFLVQDPDGYLFRIAKNI